MAAKQDIEIICADCGQKFNFTPGEQRFYISKNLTAPRRCRTCRDKRKQAAKLKQQAIDTRDLDTFRKKFREIELHDISCDAASTLLIIGNGFDLMHSVPSSYWHFRNSIGKKNSLRYALDNYLNVKEWWSDFEEALAHLNVGKMRNDLTVDMWLDVLDAYSPEVKASDFFMAAETVMEPANIITRDLPRRFRIWVEGLSVPTGDRPLKDIIVNGKVLCFNYTEFIEELYGVSHGKVCYIHGCRKKQKGHPKEELILGHKPVCEYDGERFPKVVKYLHSGGKGALLDAAYDTTVNYLNRYDEATTKDCASIIRSHQSFFDSLQSIKQIIVIGHSMAPVDWDYFMEVHRNCPDATWYIGYYGVNDLKNCDKLSAKLNIDKNRITIFKT